MDNSAIISRIEEIEAKLAKTGHEIELTFNPKKVQKIMQDVGKRSVHPISEVADHDLRSCSAFWVGIRQGGRYVACIAARISGTDGCSFSSYWSGYCDSKYPNLDPVVLSVSDEANTHITGVAVYFGGVEVVEGKKGNISRLMSLVEYAKLKAALLWDFDCIYTIINCDHRALSRVYKFGVVLDGAVKWRRPTPEGLSDNQLYLVDKRSALEARLGA